MRRIEGVRGTVVCGLVIFLAGCGMFQRRSDGPSFQVLDVNGDGQVNREEYVNGVLMDSFRKVDADRDQKITREEWAKVNKDPDAAAQFDRLDTNRDGVVTLQEWIREVEKHTNVTETFDEKDARRDNFLTVDEYSRGRNSGFTIFNMKF
ncbi:MAG TPA: hypothetical protein PLM79_02955 [Syntrophobacteraceae bacterium]|nr:hypothetical protein [Syntrophobacteraceae bacterium]